MPRPSINSDLRPELGDGSYEEAKDRFVSLAASAGIANTRIGQFGNIKHPGISDLDLVVLSETSKLSALSNAFAAERRMNPDFGYVFFHDPVYVPIDSIQEAKTLHTFANLAPLKTGCSIFQNLLCPTETHGLERSLTWLSFVISIAAQTLYPARPTSLSLRFLLLLTKNIGYSLSTLVAKKEADSISKRISESRETALAGNTDPNAFLAETEDLFHSLLRKANEAFQQNAPRRKTLVLNRKWLLLSGGDAVSRGRFFGRLQVPEPLFRFASAYLYPPQRTPSEQTFFHALESLKMELAQANLPNAFPSPFQLSRMPMFDSFVRRPISTLLSQS